MSRRFYQILILCLPVCVLSSVAVAADPTAKELAADAVGEVILQIREATTQEESIWASQPGAIRTKGADGYPSRIYKLYSAKRRIVGVSENPADDIPAMWTNRPQDYVDLNAPETGENGSLKFPIADPRTIAEGFSYTAGTEGTVVPGEGVSMDDLRLPMPVRWLYRLRDGTLGYLREDGLFIGPSPATAANPIVGRFAYWADDETCKINVNTASEGVYWDQPRCDTTEERAYAERQPVTDEYQRLPGHPARVCLSSVFLPGKRWYLPGTTGDLDAMSIPELESMWALSPYVKPGGTQGGTQIGTAVTGAEAGGVLYDSVDDFAQEVPAELKTIAERSSFLLSTESNAPELNSFGRPRFSMWPVSARSPLFLDQVDFDAATTLAGLRFRFNRQSSGSRHIELYSRNEDQRNYLRAQSFQTRPGEAGDLFSKLGTGETDDGEQVILSMLDYIRSTQLLGLLGTYYADIPRGQVSPLCACGGTSTHRSAVSVPNIPQIRGGGRFPCISEVALVFICSAVGIEGNKTISTALYLELFCPGHGHTTLAYSVRARLDDSILRITEIPPSLYVSGKQSMCLQNQITRAFGLGDTTTWGGGQGLRQLSWDANSFSFEDMAFPVSTPNLRLEKLSWDGTAHIMLFDSNSDFIDNLSSVISFSFPAATLPVPDYTSPETDTIRKRFLLGAQDKSVLIQEGDVVRSLVIPHGDYRLPMMSLHVNADRFAPHPDYFDPTKYFAHSLTHETGELAHGGTLSGNLAGGVLYSEIGKPDIPLAASDPAFRSTAPVDYPYSIDPAVTGDWDNGLSVAPDGAYFNRPLDTGFPSPENGLSFFTALDEHPDFDPLFYSPDRTMPGPGMLGSLPSGVRKGIPWRTLLFRPQEGHFGDGGVKDHLWQDLFWMPKVAPYAISHDFSTDGKVNLNYAIAPFGYIRRATALHGLLKSEKILAIPGSAGGIYKNEAGDQAWRHHIDTEETLRQWEALFAQNEVFTADSQLCEQHLVPEGVTLEEMPDYWQGTHRLSGDNTRERPYSNLGSLVTTRSNAFTVHVISESIRKDPGTPPDRFVEGVDTLIDRYQGAHILERRLTADEDLVPDYLAIPTAPGLETFYSITPNDDDLFEPNELEITGILTGSGSVTVEWTGAVGRLQQVQRSKDLENWENVGGLEISTNTYGRIIDDSVEEAVYYRVVQW